MKEVIRSRMSAVVRAKTGALLRRCCDARDPLTAFWLGYFGDHTMSKPSLTRDRIQLTHRLLESLGPEAVAYRIPDARCPGLAVRVAPSGLVSFDLAYRIAKSKIFRRLSLGKFPDVSLEQARNRANELTRAARAGSDALDVEVRAKAVATARVTVETLIEEYIARRATGRLRTAPEIRARLRRALAANLDRPADDLRRRDLRQLLDATADAGYRREAEQRRICLNGLFKWALAQDHIEINPMAGLTSFGRSPPRKRVLSADEVRALWCWLGDGKMPDDPAEVLRMQLCLGARCTEVGGMRAEEFNTTTWLWTLPEERSKNKQERVTPIVGLAREIVAKRITEFERGPLFVTDTGQWLKSMHVGHFLLNRRLPIAKFGTHDLRRTVATEMAESLGISLDTIARVIGHQAGGPSTRTLVSHYLSANFIAEKANALLAWDIRLRAIIEGTIEPHNVVPLAEARRALR
jgi:integrase